MKIINQLELLVILCAVLTFGNLLKTAECGSGAITAWPCLGRFMGMLERLILARLSNKIHLFDNLQISAWFQWVSTECNIADIPSRPQGPEEYEFYEREGCERW